MGSYVSSKQLLPKPAQAIETAARLGLDFLFV